MPSLLHPDTWPVVTLDEERRQLERILHSATFRSAPGLQRFLEHVVTKTIQGLSDEIKEYEIAAEVLGRPSDYDPRLDTTVRVQAHRLREKLEEYYAHEGAGDEVIIALPKGHYVPQFQRREKANGESLGMEGRRLLEATELPGFPPAHQPAHMAEGGSGGKQGRKLLQWLGAAGVSAVLFTSGLLLSPATRNLCIFSSLTNHGLYEPSRQAGVPSEVSRIWDGFWKQSGTPIVAYSNSIFLVTQTGDLLRLRGGGDDSLGAPAAGAQAVELAQNPRLVREAGPVFFDDDHTGTGEVMGVYYLTRLFLKRNLPFTVERSQLVQARDLRSHNMIFLGSTIENPILAGLPLEQNFVFSEPQTPPTVWRNRILNLHPLPGEKPFYEIKRDKQTRVLSVDYGLISFLPGIVPGREIVILGGLTTLGTEAATQFVTSEPAANAILTHLPSGGQSDGEMPRFFQAVLKVRVKNGEVLSIQCVAARTIGARTSRPKA